MIPYYQIAISCFLIDIDHIAKILKILSDGSSVFSGASLSQTFPKMKSNNLIFMKIIFLKMIWYFPWIIWGLLVSQKINNIDFEAQGHVRKSQNHRDEGFERSPITKSKSYKFKMEQNNLPELLSLSFP